jgi:hypothetical protein
VGLSCGLEGQPELKTQSVMPYVYGYENRLRVSVAISGESNPRFGHAHTKSLDRSSTMVASWVILHGNCFTYVECFHTLLHHEHFEFLMMTRDDETLTHRVPSHEFPSGPDPAIHVVRTLIPVGVDEVA